MDARITIALPPEDKAHLEAIAKRRRMGVSSVIRTAILRELKEDARAEEAATAAGLTAKVG